MTVVLIDDCVKVLPRTIIEQIADDKIYFARSACRLRTAQLLHEVE